MGDEEEAEEITVKYWYRSCSGRVRRNEFTVGYNIITGEAKWIKDLVPLYKGAYHRTATCSKTVHLVAEKKDLEELAKKGWIFKYINSLAKESHFFSFPPIRDIKFIESKVEKTEYGKEFVDIISINGVKFKVYRDRIKPIDVKDYLSKILPLFGKNIVPKSLNLVEVDEVLVSPDKRTTVETILLTYCIPDNNRCLIPEPAVKLLRKNALEIGIKREKKEEKIALES